MRILPAAFLIAWILGPATAQVDMRLEFTQEESKFLPAEPAEVAVRIANFTGAPLRLGERPDWLRFWVENVDGSVVHRGPEPAESGAFTLAPSTRGTLRYDLAPLFRLDRPGSFKVTATAVLPSGDSVASEPVEFEITRGVTLWERDFGMPGTSGERRRYLVQQANYLRRPQLYVCVTDASGSSTLRVTRLGGVVAFNPPAYRLDGTNRLHVLHQFGSSRYLHHRIGHDGSVEVREIYAARKSRPALGMNDTGDVAVIHADRLPGPGESPNPKRPGRPSPPEDRNAKPRTSQP